MPPSQIPQDDIQDVIEMTHKLEKEMNDVLRGQDHCLAMSALMSASVNCCMANCETLEEVVFFRNLYIKIFDNYIKNIRLK